MSALNISYYANGIVSFIAAVCLSWVVLDPRVQEGLIVKIGLMMMIFSLMITAGLTLQDSTAGGDYWRAALWLRVGIAVVCIGVFIRVSGGPFCRPHRRITDWFKFENHRGEDDIRSSSRNRPQA